MLEQAKQLLEEMQDIIKEKNITDPEMLDTFEKLKVFANKTFKEEGMETV